MTNLVRLFFAAFILFSSSALAGDVRALAERLEEKASHGDVKAAYKLGLLFSDGKKVSPDFYTAIEWYERAANQGYAKAMKKLADIYQTGKGGHLDYEKAEYWNEKAAQKGSRVAMANLGELFLKKNDFEQSAYWYEKSAVKGHPVGMREIGRYYLNGTGVHFSLKHAFAWLELAIKKGDYAAKSLQRKITLQKGQDWADNMRRRVNNRMIPVKYWDAH